MIEDVPHFMLRCTAYKKLREELLKSLNLPRSVDWEGLGEGAKISLLLGFDERIDGFCPQSL